MTQPTVNRRFAVTLAGTLAAGLALGACGRERSGEGPRAPLGFSILSAEGQATAEPVWRPLIEDLSEALGAAVEPFFAPSYDAAVAAMQAKRVQAGWFSARPALDALDQADAEVVARTVNLAGEDSYRSVLIARRGAGVTLDKVLDCGRRYSFGMGDARSTTGALAPMTFLFNPRGIEPRRCFSDIRTDNHQAQAFAVATGSVDVAAVNSVTVGATAERNPQIADQLEEIWRSPPIPEGGILVRDDLDPAVKERVRAFFLGYGQGQGATAERQRQTLARLNYSQFRAADDGYLDPVREMVADEALGRARASGDRPAMRAAEQELRRLRAKREVQP